MKKPLVLMILLALTAGGCAYYQKEVHPEKFYNAHDMNQADLERGDYFVKTRYGFRLLTIPISVPEPNDLISEVVREQNAVGVTNIEVEFSEFNAFLFGIPKVRITGSVVNEKQ